MPDFSPHGLRGTAATLLREHGFGRAKDKAALEARDGNGRTPLHVATFAKRGEAVRALTGAAPITPALDNDRYDAVTIAAVADDEATVRVLLAEGASAKLVTSRYDGTALIAAAHLGHDGGVRQLIAAGAPLDHVNNWTAAIEAVVLGDGGARPRATLKTQLNARQHPARRPREARAAAAGALARPSGDGGDVGGGCKVGG